MAVCGEVPTFPILLDDLGMIQACCIVLTLVFADLAGEQVRQLSNWPLVKGCSCTMYLVNEVFFGIKPTEPTD